jgi:transcriptional regulator with XRE-family HTH domain
MKEGYISEEEQKLSNEIGQRVRQVRLMRGMSQEKLGEAVGITFQQIQKYENGKNRISAAKLLLFARVLQVTVDDFYGQDGNGVSIEKDIASFSPKALTLGKLVTGLSEPHQSVILTIARTIARTPGLEIAA